MKMLALLLRSLTVAGEPQNCCNWKQNCSLIRRVFVILLFCIRSTQELPKIKFIIVHVSERVKVPCK